MSAPAADAAFIRLLAAKPKLWHMRLWGPSIGDDELKELSRGAGLSGVILAGTKATDAGLEHLAGTAPLRALNLTDTKVTEAGVKKLAKALPQCQITWDGGVIEPGKKP